MSVKTKILDYVKSSNNLVTIKEIMSVLTLHRPIIDKYLSELCKEEVIFRVNWGMYFKNKLNNYEITREEIKKLKRAFPKLYNVYRCAVKRCQNPNHPDYKYYGAKGIRVKITFAQLIEIWIRDKGWLLKQPSVDRKDSNKSYTKDNTQFIELKDNVKKALKKEAR